MRETLRVAVLGACEHMGVSVLISEKCPDEPGWHCGPAGPSLYKGDDGAQMIWMGPAHTRHDEGWLWALHELEHLVFWRDGHGTDVPEQLMMPWAVGALRAYGIPASVYMKSGYTLGTTLPEMYHAGKYYHEVEHWKHPTRAGWYRRARKANQAAGTIDARGVATWKAPDWRLIRVEEHEDTFCTGR